MTETTITLSVNGVMRTVAVTEDALLLEVLREDLALTGTKEGCGNGECGACTVLIDGQPVASCIFPAKAAHGRSIETIEGLGAQNRLHPLQSWFLKLGAVQCGFCTPGLLMTCKAFLNQGLNPSAEEVKQAIAGNLCRCTGYIKVVKAVMAAAGELRGEPPADPQDVPGCPPVGRSLIKVDGLPKVLGTAKFAADLNRPGMLHAAMVVSPHPHARILSIDRQSALISPGVERVVTAQDIPGETSYGIIVKDQQFLAEEIVRYPGEPVAVVIAESRRSARLAAQELRVKYEELDAVFDAKAAMCSDAIKVHAKGNVLLHRKIRKGNIDEGFAQADVVVERNFTTQVVDHAYIEPEAAIAYWDGQMLVVECCSQGPHYLRHEIARMLGFPISRVRVIQATTGGGFGGKIDLLLQHFVALGTYLTGRPVKMVWSREESLRTSTKRHAFELQYTFGATRDGRLTAAKAEIIGNTGAYASYGPAVLTRSATMALGPYDCPNVHVDAYAVYTHTAIAGAMRGFGAPQMSPCHEPLMDEIARKCGLSPLEVRRINMVRPGSSTVTQQVLEEGVGALETLERVADQLSLGNTEE